MLYNSLSHFITHGSEHNMTTRWHRVKCKVRWTWYMRMKPTILDWWHNERYVSLVCNSRGEVRAWRVSSVMPSVAHDRFHTKHWDGIMMSMSLPPGVKKFEDLPQFRTSDACFEYASVQWPQLQA